MGGIYKAKECNDKDLLRFIAFCVVLKTKYVSSRVNNYSKTSLSKKVAISPAQIALAVSYGLKNGLCRMEGKCLVVSKLNIKEKSQNTSIDLSKYPSIDFTNYKQVKKFLHYAMFLKKLYHIDHLEYIRDLKKDMGIKISQAEKKGYDISKKRAGQYLSLLRLENSGFESHSGISYLGASKIFGLSISTTKRYLKQMTKKKLIKKKHYDKVKLDITDERVCNYKLAYFGYESFPKGVFSYGNAFFYQPSNRYTLSSLSLPLWRRRRR